MGKVIVTRKPRLITWCRHYPPVSEDIIMPSRTNMEFIQSPFCWIRGNFPNRTRKYFLGMLGFPNAEHRADSSTPPLPTLNYGEERSIPHPLRLRRRPRYSSAASSSSPLPSKSYRDIPNELWYLTFEFLIPSDITLPTHRTLVRVRGVCRSWRETAERLIWETIKSLVASSRLFDPPSDDFLRDFAHEILLWLEETFPRLVEGRKRDTHHSSNGTALRLVAFHLDERYRLDQNLAKFFVSALSNCERADIIIDNFPASIDPFYLSGAQRIESPPAIPLRQFSFSSINLGIRDTLPPQFDFPWHSLRQELPWSQLTDITLDCVLSYDDALVVLSATVNVGRAELGRLSLTGLPQDGSSAMVNIISTLHTLKINTSIDLRPLFSRLDLPALEDLQLAAYRDSTSNAPKNHILNPNLNIRWDCLKRLSLRSDLTYRQCDLNSILRHCHQLKQLKWEGDRSEFKINDLLFKALTEIQELALASDHLGHQHLFDNVGFTRNITKLSLSHHHDLLAGDDNLPNLLHITISGPINLVHIFQILRFRTQRLLSGDFRLGTVTRFCPGQLTCEALLGLKLTLPNVSSFPWGKLYAPQLKTLEMNLPCGARESTPCEMEDFCSVHFDTIISISAQ